MLQEYVQVVILSKIKTYNNSYYTRFSDVRVPRLECGRLSPLNKRMPLTHFGKSSRRIYIIVAGIDLSVAAAVHLLRKQTSAMYLYLG